LITNDSENEGQSDDPPTQDGGGSSTTSATESAVKNAAQNQINKAHEAGKKEVSNQIKGNLKDVVGEEAADFIADQLTEVIDDKLLSKAKDAAEDFIGSLFGSDDSTDDPGSDSGDDSSDENPLGVDDQENLSITIQTTLDEGAEEGSEVFIVDRMIGVEEISSPFEFELLLHSSDDSIDLKSLLGTDVKIQVDVINALGDKESRYFCGVIGRMEDIQTLIDYDGNTVSYYKAYVYPKFWLLKFSKDYRFFLNKTTLDIIKGVLKDNNAGEIEDKVQSAGQEEREYCVQYGESHFDFVSRLMEEAGIFYYFEHKEDGHVMVLSDASNLALGISEKSLSNQLSDKLEGFLGEEIAGFLGDEIAKAVDNDLVGHVKHAVKGAAEAGIKAGLTEAFGEDVTNMIGDDMIGAVSGDIANFAGNKVQDQLAQKEDNIKILRSFSNCIGLNVDSGFRVSHQIIPESFQAVDYNYLSPLVELKPKTSSSYNSGVMGAVYEYPGIFQELDQGEDLVSRRLESLEWQNQICNGQGTITKFMPGRKFNLQGHPRDELNDEYFILKVRHIIDKSQLSELSLGNGIDGNKLENQEQEVIYRNEFQVIPFQSNFRPLLKTKKPRVYSNETAIVTGPDEQKVHCDEYGRIQVKFHWDMQSKPPMNAALKEAITGAAEAATDAAVEEGMSELMGDDFDEEFTEMATEMATEVAEAVVDAALDELLKDDATSCWIRVAQNWAGTNWGGLVIPRIGMEVVISYINGDPDRPLVTGCVYNADHMPPDYVNDGPSKSTFKTQSMEDESGFNELRFEDKDGEEQIYIHAQRNFESDIVHSRIDNIQTGNDILIIHEGDKKVLQKGQGTKNILHIKDGESITVIKKGDYKITLKEGNIDIKVTGKINIKSTDDITMESEKNITLKAQENINIEAVKEVSIKAETDIKQKATQNIEMEADQKITAKAGADMKMEAGADIGMEATANIKGKAGADIGLEATANIKEKAGAELKQEASASIERKSSGAINDKGAMVSIASDAALDLKGSAAVNIKGAMVSLN